MIFPLSSKYRRIRGLLVSSLANRIQISLAAHKEVLLNSTLVLPVNVRSAGREQADAGNCLFQGNLYGMAPPSSTREAERSLWCERILVRPGDDNCGSWGGLGGFRPMSQGMEDAGNHGVAAGDTKTQ